MWVKALVVAALALSGATTAWTAVGGTAAAEPITGVRPVWSPNGGRSRSPTSSARPRRALGDLRRQRRRDSGRRQVTRGSLFQPHGIAWSPDGNTLAFDAYVSDGPTSVYTVPVAGGNASKMTTGWSAAWASGSKLVVTDESEGPFGRDVQPLLGESDGTRSGDASPVPGELSSTSPAATETRCSRADATKITFDNNLSGAASAVYTMNADGSGRRQLTPYSPPATLPQSGTERLGARLRAQGPRRRHDEGHDPRHRRGRLRRQGTGEERPPAELVARREDHRLHAQRRPDLHALCDERRRHRRPPAHWPGRVDDDHHGDGASGASSRRSSARPSPNCEEAPHEGALQDRQGDEGRKSAKVKTGVVVSAKPKPGAVARGGHGRRAVGQPRQEVDRVRASR